MAILAASDVHLAARNATTVIDAKVPQITTLIPRDKAPAGLQGLMRDGNYGVIYEQKGTPYAVKVEWLLSPFGAPCTRPPSPCSAPRPS